MLPPLRRRKKREKAMGGSSSPSLSFSLLLFILSLSPHYFLSSSEPTAFEDVSMETPTLHFVVSPYAGNSCERVRVTSISRLNLKSYASSFHVSLNVSEAIAERLEGKVEVCLHRNVSLGFCQCDNDEWKLLQNGLWTAVVSPYENRYIDIKLNSKASVSFTVSVEQEFHQWRLLCLGFGFLLLLFAPIVSNWVPFYYSSSMALGVLLVVLIILFQGMKLLPMGRKNIIYLTIYGSVLGVGSYIVHYFSTVVNSILVNFGLSEEMHNPVSVFLLAGIILAGAALGYWVVRKFVLAEDGSVDAGIAQFVKWSMRVIAVVFIFQSTLDALLAVVALCTCWCICSLITLRKWWSPVTMRQAHLKNGNLWQQRARQASASNRQAMFLSRSAKKDMGRTVRGISPSRAHVWSNSPIKGLVYSSPNKEPVRQPEEYYSTFHRTPTPRKFSKKEWADFTRESTREALDEWASTPEVAKWVADNAHRMRLNQDITTDDSMGSSSGSSEETAVENNGFLKWY